MAERGRSRPARQRGNPGASDESASARVRRSPPGARPALQRRSRDKRDRLIRAGIAAFARDGYESARVVDIVRDAGISVGVFYQRFKDKRGFFAALEAEFVEQGKANWDRLIEHADPAWGATELLERMMQNLGRVIERNMGFFRALITLGHHDKTVVAPAVDLDRYGAERLEAYLVERGMLDPDRIGRDDVYFALATVVKSLVVTAAMGAGPYRANDSRTARRLARLFAAYLSIELD